MQATGAVRAGTTSLSGQRQGALGLVASQQAQFILAALAAFAVYWGSSLILVARDGLTHFAADTWFYTELAGGNIFERIADNYSLDRIFRFHPVTVVLAAGWLKILSPLTYWIEPLTLLKGLFAAVGALGAWAAMWAFSAFAQRRIALLLGIVYASSLSIWYFSSLEESKIVSGTLVALYIAAYLHLRTRWTVRGAVLLTAILLLACLNESIAVLLVMIPAMDTLVQRGLDIRQLWRQGWWIIGHALASPISIAMLELIMRGRAGPAGEDPEGANHFSMLLYYFSKIQYTWENTYTFLVRWFFFDVAAPAATARQYADPSINYGGDFEVRLANYLSSPVSALLVVLFCAMLIVSFMPRYRGAYDRGIAAILAALAAYALLRGVFFFNFIPSECILYSPSVVLAHLLIVAIPFALSRFPWKLPLLGAFAAALFIVNGSFIIGP